MFCYLPAHRRQISAVILDIGESASFEVIYRADRVQRSQGQLRLSVINNQYEDSLIQLVAEGYQDMLSLEVPQGFLSYSEAEEGSMAGDDVPGWFIGWLEL